jgi:hypothetical protein
VFELFPEVDPFTQLALVYVAFPATWLITSAAQFTFSSVILKRKACEIGQ